ncbi:ATP-binding protein [Nocardia blacklockiae]|uniref:ATP-binding protein n=1 Tax=Nocardia blacklockiae TaxID=480036 RepID=UPI001896214A|nr:ATP-binding protein [Nocardia blacklockiae]MBF6171294.1 ATP-binding protein [Nocardia blacklockiae]
MADPAKDFKQLVRELERLADHPFRKAFRQAGDVDERNKFPTVAQIVRRCVGDRRWEHSPSMSATSTIREAIARIPKVMTGRSPEKNRDAGGDSSWRGVDEHRIAEIIFGFRDPEVIEICGHPLSELQYDAHYRPAVVQVAGLQNASPSTKSRMIHVVRQDVAYALLDMAKASETLQNQAEQPSLSSASYLVTRPKVSAKLFELLHNLSPQLIWVYGEPGSGKSTAVRQAFQEASVNAIWIDCSEDMFNPRRLHLQLVAVLRDHGVEISRNDDEVRMQFCELLHKEPIGKIFVIDNYEVRHFPEILSLRDMSSSILVIGRSLPPHHVEGAKPIEIGDLEDKEAHELVGHYLPGTSVEKREAISTALFGRALLIDQACRAAVGLNKSIEDYLQELRNPGELLRVIDGASEEVNRSIGNHYRSIFNSLEKAAPLSIRLLTLACLRYYGMPVQEIKREWDRTANGAYLFKAVSGFEPSSDLSVTDKYRLTDENYFEFLDMIPSWGKDTKDRRQVSVGISSEVEAVLSVVQRTGLVTVGFDEAGPGDGPYDYRRVFMHRLTSFMILRLCSKEIQNMYDLYLSWCMINAAEYRYKQFGDRAFYDLDE